MTVLAFFKVRPSLTPSFKFTSHNKRDNQPYIWGWSFNGVHNFVITLILVQVPRQADNTAFRWLSILVREIHNWWLYKPQPSLCIGYLDTFHRQKGVYRALALLVTMTTPA